MEKTLRPIVLVSEIYFVNKLPKTRSSKIMRRVIKAIIANKPLGDHSTIQDEPSIDMLRNVAAQ